jgi:hypothetical protein
MPMSRLSSIGCTHPPRVSSAAPLRIRSRTRAGPVAHTAKAWRSQPAHCTSGPAHARSIAASASAATSKAYPKYVDPSTQPCVTRARRRR